MIKQGDIFKSGADFIVCPVNCVGTLGKGLALAFKKTFPECEAPYKQACGKTLNNIGDYHIHNNIIYFATKKHWKNSSDLQLVKQGLIHFKANMDQNKSYAFPALGCGLGDLKWTDLKQVFEEIFTDCPNIQLYQPA